MRTALKPALLAALQPETNTLLAAMTSPQPGNRRLTINRLIAALKQSGVWAKLDLLYVLAAGDSQAAGINWKTPGAFTLSAVNAPAFTADRGYTMNGTTQYLDTGWDAATNAVAMSRDSAHYADYVRSGTLNSGGFGTGTAIYTEIIALPAGNQDIRVNSGNGSTGQGGNPGLPVWWLGVRRDGANQRGYFNGVFKTNGAIASDPLSNNDLNIGRCQTTSFDDYQHMAVHCGAQLSDGEIAATYAALNAYRQAVGA